MSTFIKIPGVNPPSTRPRVDLVDSMLPDKGALYLYDATHPASKWGSGKAVGLSIPNVVAAQAKALTGSTLDCTLDYAGEMTVSRSGKSGLHVVPSTAIPLPSGSFAAFRPPSELANYIHSNPYHSYYMSQWTRATRVQEGTPGTTPFTAAINNGSTSYLALMYHGLYGELGVFPTGAQALGARNGRSIAGEATLQNVGSAGWVGTIPSAASGVSALPFLLGRTGIVQSTSYAHPALVLYRCYLEDLTVSGRTYAEADAADNAAYTREVLTTGGRYYGDTV